MTDELQVGEMNRYNKQWGVVIFKNNKKVAILEDKPKLQALKFANKYMKKHDRC